MYIYIYIYERGREREIRRNISTIHKEKQEIGTPNRKMDKALEQILPI